VARSLFLTDEQQAVINHPRGRHARVLAVAGSGKTTTMAHRVKFLIQEAQVSPKSIGILMFNRLARIQFKQKLEDLGLSPGAPAVHTFHSYAYQLIGRAVDKGWIPGLLSMWIEDKEELVRITLHRAIQNVARTEDLDSENFDVDEIMEAISLWKGSLIPPDRAGYRGDSSVPLVYREFERLRNEAQGVTFDDFVPLAIEILETDRQTTRELVNRFDFLIVDEYQDVNYGQQWLIELLAGNRADIMVVGDDDQTIYEWRGARPDYILKFGEVFDNKPYTDYTLSHSFRFGPVIAQCAQNVIEFNVVRVKKSIVAHNMTLLAQVHVIEDRAGQKFDVSKELAEQVVQLVKETNDPSKIIVLGRMFAQMNLLETEFLARGIPYRVEGRAPFFKRREIQAMLDYVRLALALDDRVNQRLESLLLSIANMPNRRLSRKGLVSAMRRAYDSGCTVREALTQLAGAFASPLTRSQRQSAEDLLNVLDRLHEILHTIPARKAGFVFRWLVDTVDFVSHFETYYGKGEASEDRRRSVMAFCDYADLVDKHVADFLVHVDSLDTTRGVPKEEQIVFTTVFRTKGLEYDYVIIPSCEEGYMPILFGSPNLTYDLKGHVEQPAQSQVIENERRLFYVAITRAKKAVFIGTSRASAEGLATSAGGGQVSRFIHETEYQAVLDVMTPLQQVAAGHADAKRTLLAAVTRHGSCKRVMKSLLGTYLSQLGEMALLADARAIEAKQPEKKFRYPEPLQMIFIDQPPPTISSTKRRWWDRDDFR